MTSHLVQAPALLIALARSYLESCDEDIKRQAIVEGFPPEQIRQALIDTHQGRHDHHLGERDVARREAREAGR